MLPLSSNCHSILSYCSMKNFLSLYVLCNLKPLKYMPLLILICIFKSYCCTCTLKSGRHIYMFIYTIYIIFYIFNCIWYVQVLYVIFITIHTMHIYIIIIMHNIHCILYMLYEVYFLIHYDLRSHNELLIKYAYSVY